jgi:hypothetical protein
MAGEAGVGVKARTDPVVGSSRYDLDSGEPPQAVGEKLLFILGQTVQRPAGARRTTTDPGVYNRPARPAVGTPFGRSGPRSSAWQYPNERAIHNAVRGKE